MRDDRFEWDDAKAARNMRKHGVTFDEAREVFNDTNSFEEEDDDPGEQRWKIIGMSRVGLLAVIFTERGARIRIISAREADAHEQATYHRQTLP